MTPPPTAAPPRAPRMYRRFLSCWPVHWFRRCTPFCTSTPHRPPTQAWPQWPHTTAHAALPSCGAGLAPRNARRARRADARSVECVSARSGISTIISTISMEPCDRGTHRGGRVAALAAQPSAVARLSVLSSSWRCRYRSGMAPPLMAARARGVRGGARGARRGGPEIHACTGCTHLCT